MFVFREDSRTESGALNTGSRTQVKTTKRTSEYKIRRMVVLCLVLFVLLLRVMLVLIELRVKRLVVIARRSGTGQCTPD